MIKDFIQFDDGEITTILTINSENSNFITRAIIENYNKKQRFMVWQNDDVYFPCARLRISQKMSFETMFLNYKSDFDVLIINAFTDESNRYEIKRFMKNIKEVDCFKDKKVIAIFEKDKHYDFELSLPRFNIHKEYIKKYSNHIYKFESNIDDSFSGKLSLEDINKKEKSNYSVSGDYLTFSIKKQ